MATVGSIVCRSCGKNALESRSYLERIGKPGNGPECWRCAGGCSGPALDNDERVLAAIKGKP